MVFFKETNLIRLVSGLGVLKEEFSRIINL